MTREAEPARAAMKPQVPVQDDSEYSPPPSDLMDGNQTFVNYADNSMSPVQGPMKKKEISPNLKVLDRDSKEDTKSG